jgi:hypothetical protein
LAIVSGSFGPAAQRVDSFPLSFSLSFPDCDTSAEPFGEAPIWAVVWCPSWPGLSKSTEPKINTEKVPATLALG